MELLNTPGERTFFKPNIDRESILDLTFSTRYLATQIQDWQILPDLGSDHKGILFTIPGTSILVPNPAQSGRFNTKQADWSLFASCLKANITNSIELNSIRFQNIQIRKVDQIEFLTNGTLPNSIQDSLHRVSAELTRAIQEAAKISIPTSIPGTRLKF